MRRIESLAQAPKGEFRTVQRILFDGPRARCAELGLEPGADLEVVARSAGGVLVRGESGRVVRCPDEVARFVETSAPLCALPDRGAVAAN